MPAHRIRDADTSDAEGIAHVHVRAWEGAYRRLLADEVVEAHARKRLSFWRTYLAAPPANEHVLVAVGGGCIDGFTVARPSPGDDARADQAEVSALYVEPEAWGRGIGGALLDALLGRLREDPLQTATLWVLAGNVRARRFYERRGWMLDRAERIHPDRGVRELRYALLLRPRL